MNRNFSVVILLVLWTGLSQAGVYKHVDEKGNVTYSNVPSSNAKKIDLPPIVVVPSPSVNSGEIEERIVKRRESMKLDEQREQLQNKISEEEKRLHEVKNEYKDGVPDRLGSERNYQRYLNRVERLREEINVRERNLTILRNELQNLPDKIRQP
ncbi:MAG: DUF4124 domain-containing protein [Nitrosomonas sp.]|nr:MAG: DUF4124 domain-containing protein [Nitrosomonas sp.]